MKSVVIAVCGHVDHGKTALVRALTGIDTDSLPEEKRRGMTIEPGYARWQVSGSLTAGFVDVPGHEKLLKNMICASADVDMAMLVVDVREGVKPQTQEHLRIMELLGIPVAVVVVTKCNGIATEQRTGCADGIRAVLPERFAGAPLVYTDSITGEGLAELGRVVAGQAVLIPGRPVAPGFLLWIDRVFTRHGYGTIVTGTLAHGVLSVGGIARLLPQDARVRLRNVQVFGQDCECAVAGSRVAVNIAGNCEAAAKGSLLCAEIEAEAVSVCGMAEYPGIKSGWVRLYTGTLEIQGAIRRMKHRGEYQWEFHSPVAFPLTDGCRVLIRPCNSRELTGATRLYISRPEIYAKHPEGPVAQIKKPAGISVGNVLYSDDKYNGFIALLRSHFEKNEAVSLAQFRDLAHINREQARNLLEHFDAQKLTLRSGNVRVPLSGLDQGKAGK